MYSTPENVSNAALVLYDAQVTLFTSLANAMMDAGMSATESHIDAIKKQIVSASITYQQWMSGGLTDTPARVALD